MSDDEEMAPPKVTGSPERLWLNYGEIDEDVDHHDCDEVTWCDDMERCLATA